MFVCFSSWLLLLPQPQQRRICIAPGPPVVSSSRNHLTGKLEGYLLLLLLFVTTSKQASERERVFGNIVLLLKLSYESTYGWFQHSVALDDDDDDDLSLLRVER